MLHSFRSHECSNEMHDWRALFSCNQHFSYCWDNNISFCFVYLSLPLYDDSRYNFAVRKMLKIKWPTWRQRRRKKDTQECQVNIWGEFRFFSRSTLYFAHFLLKLKGVQNNILAFVRFWLPIRSACFTLTLLKLQSANTKHRNCLRLFS